jgi:hypothetical protein
MIELPTKRVEVTQVNPDKLILFSSPKAGKTTALAMLENNLILDLEDGAGYVNALKINVKDIARQESIKPIVALKQVINKIKEANAANRGYVYKYITIDTISALENDYAPDLALKMHLATPIGRNFQGDDVLTLPNGQGWGILRNAILLIVQELEELCETLIISAHTKDKIVEFQGKELAQRMIDLAGKTPSILCSKSDAIGYVYRKDNKTIVNFQTAESLSVGARPEHLKNQEIVLLESDENGEFISHWDKIFVE